MALVNIDLESDYPAQIHAGTTIHTKSGFMIGTVLEVVDVTDSSTPTPVTSQELSRRTVMDAAFPGGSV